MDALQTVCRDVKAASRRLARLPSHRRDVVLGEMADALERRSAEIVRENADDVEAARRAHSPGALIDRLYLDEDRVAEMAAGIRAVAALPDPVGVLEEGRRLPNGLELVRERVPLGVVAVVYEGRPNVAADAAALCLKSGNAVILRGSRIAARSNRILTEVLTGALIEADAPRWGIALLGQDREEIRRLVQMDDVVDLVVPRGGGELKAFLREHSRVPVIYAAAGNNHVYVDAAADLDMALKIAVNAKVQRPGVCNAVETLLVHEAVALEFLPRALERLGGQGVELRIDRRGLVLLADAGEGLAEATDADYAREFLDLTLAVRVVASLEEATDHISRFGSGHSEAIVTGSLGAAQAFRAAVDAAAVCVNASTRFVDGAEFGMGAELAISTQKLHARGPIGLGQLTTYRYLLTGDGHVR